MCQGGCVMWDGEGRAPGICMTREEISGPTRTFFWNLCVCVNPTFQKQPLIDAGELLPPSLTRHVERLAVRLLAPYTVALKGGQLERQGKNVFHRCCILVATKNKGIGRIWFFFNICTKPLLCLTGSSRMSETLSSSYSTRASERPRLNPRFMQA